MTTSLVTYGFAATLTAKPGRGDDLIQLLLSGLEGNNPATSEHCLVYLVSRSASSPDVAHVIEGWTTEEDHHRVFATDEAKAIVAGFAELLDGESVYTDLTPVGGKANL
jgi:quinol monooxygenase YgiN